MDSGVKASPQAHLDGARILVVEDDAMVAKVIARSLERVGAATVCCQDLDGAYLALQGDDPPFDAAVVDVGLPDGIGFSLVGALRSRTTPCCAVVITGIVDADVVRKCIDGAAASLLAKPFDHAGLIEAVAAAREQTNRWRAWCKLVGLSEAVASPPHVGDTHRIVGALVQRGQLTARERDTLELLLKGAQNVEIAEHLGISANTVKYHMRNLLRKLGFETRTDLFRWLARSRSGE